MAKAKSATPAVEATAGVTSKEETAIPTPQTQDQGAIIKDLESKLEVAGSEIINLKNALEKCQLDLEQSLASHTATLADLTIRNLQFKNLQDSIVNNSQTDDFESNIKTDFEYNGRRYGFTDRAPQKLSFDGQLYTQQELLNDEDAMTSLIVGESAFVKRIV